ncbi:MAG: hypothetical protein K0U37_01445 [Gammaproteobacteria bacterium]|nr:hypothetical protein [Gammaproteobacteria bacterium]
MPSSQSFFDQLGARLRASHTERSVEGTYLYNHYGEPSQPLNNANAHWFNYSKRFNQADFSAFKSYSAFSDDVTSLIMKPYIYSALAAYEVQKFMLCFPAALAQAVKLSPTGVANKLVDMVEAVVASIVLTSMAAIELYLQVASLAVRLCVTGLNVLGVDTTKVRSADVDDSVGFSCSV